MKKTRWPSGTCLGTVRRRDGGRVRLGIHPDKGIVTVGITLFAPMNYYEGDKLVGFDTELTTAVFAKLGIEPEFIEISWDAKEIELNSKNIDCIWNGMCITEERKQNMSMSNPYLYNTQAMVMKADREDEIMADIAGRYVVAEQGSTGEGKLLGNIADDETVEVSAVEYFKDANYTAVDPWLTLLRSSPAPRTSPWWTACAPWAWWAKAPTMRTWSSTWTTTSACRSTASASAPAAT